MNVLLIFGIFLTHCHSRGLGEDKFYNIMSPLPFIFPATVKPSGAHTEQNSATHLLSCISVYKKIGVLQSALEPKAITIGKSPRGVKKNDVVVSEAISRKDVRIATKEIQAWAVRATSYRH